MPLPSPEPVLSDPKCRSFRFTEERLRQACRLVAAGGVPTDASGRVQWRDSETAGLFLRVTRSGTGTLTLFFKRDGRAVRKAIGPVGEVGLSDARKVALALRYDRTLAAHVQPKERPGPIEVAHTVGDTFHDYIAAAEAGSFKLSRRREAITERTARNYRDCFRATLQQHAGQSLEWLASNVLRLHQELGTPAGTGATRRPGRPYQANRMIQAARNIFTYAAHAGTWTKPNPCVDPATGGSLAKFEEHSRDRILSDAEEARLGAELLVEAPIWRDLFAVALLTGRRMSAVCTMAWADVDLGRSVWTVPRERMKGRRSAHGLQLDPDVVAILERRRADAEDDAEWVFPAIRSPGPVPSWKSAWSRIRKNAGLFSKDRSRTVIPHDLRRSWGSRLVEAGVSTVAVNAALGNSPASVSMTARVYMHVPDAVQSEAVEAAYKRRQARIAKAKPARRARTSG